MALTSLSFFVAHLQDKTDTNTATEEDKALFRLLMNANKYIASLRTTEMLHRAIEVLGGNGAIETFSILPRLYRDNIVFENWEGTHNTISLQGPFYSLLLVEFSSLVKFSEITANLTCTTILRRE
jgi:alkylation response protein AidB-like acyl-CoA dehydrogenase